MDRRTFIATLTVTAAIPGMAAVRRSDPPASLPAKALGETGRTLPRLGLGTSPVGNLQNDDTAVAVVRRALDLGVRYLDTAPSYSDGRAERRIGAAIRDWLSGTDGASREDLFIATKTHERGRDGARRDLEESLERLGVDYVDSVQCHNVRGDVERLFEPGSVLEALEAARDEGLVRYIGVTGHRNPRWLVEAIQRYPFATALVPVNPVDVHHLSFVREFLPIAAERDVAVIAMKIFGGGFLLERRNDEGELIYTVADLLRYALAQPGVVLAVPGCDQLEHVDADHAGVVAYEAPDAEWVTGMEGRAGVIAGERAEWYKEH